MFQKAQSIQELNEMRVKKEQKVVRNKKRRSTREISERRSEIAKGFTIRAKDIITSTIQLP